MSSSSVSPYRRVRPSFILSHRRALILSRRAVVRSYFFSPHRRALIFYLAAPSCALPPSRHAVVRSPSVLPHHRAPVLSSIASACALLSSHRTVVRLVLRSAVPLCACLSYRRASSSIPPRHRALRPPFRRAVVRPSSVPPRRHALFFHPVAPSCASFVFPPQYLLRFRRSSEFISRRRLCTHGERGGLQIRGVT